jgi:hypothetical protein
MVRNIVWLAAIAVVCVGLAGCRHRTQVAAMPPLPPPGEVPLVSAPEPAKPPLVASVPVPGVPLPKRAAQPKATKPKKKAEPAPLPELVASATPPPVASVIGSLSAGGDEVTEQKKQAAEAMAEVEKRLAGLAAATVASQKEGLARVRNFLRQAHEAYSSGDADGALTLATKAKVLLEDLLK